MVYSTHAIVLFVLEVALRRKPLARACLACELSVEAAAKGVHAYGWLSKQWFSFGSP